VTRSFFEFLGAAATMGNPHCPMGKTPVFSTLSGENDTSVICSRRGGRPSSRASESTGRARIGVSAPFRLGVPGAIPMSVAVSGRGSSEPLYGRVGFSLDGRSGLKR
jgi:hypothetical protein